MQKFTDIAGGWTGFTVFAALCLVFVYGIYAWLANLFRKDREESRELTELDVSVTYDPRPGIIHLDEERKKRREITFLRGEDADQLNLFPPGGNNAA